MPHLRTSFFFSEFDSSDASWIDSLFGPELLESDLGGDADLAADLARPFDHRGTDDKKSAASREPLSERESLRRGISEVTPFLPYVAPRFPHMSGMNSSFMEAPETPF